MHTNLVRAPRLNHDLDQGRFLAEELHRTEFAHRRLAGLMRLHGALAAHANIGPQRDVDPFLPQIPLALKQREIPLLESPTLAQQRMQGSQRRRIPGDEQTTAGVAIEPMGQFQALSRSQGAERLDHAKADAAAAVNRDTRGLVDHDQMRVLVHDGGANGLQHAGRWPGRRATVGLTRFGSWLGTHGRDPDLVARLQPRLGAGSTAVDPHLSLADDAVNPAARNAPQHLLDEVVEALAGGRFGNLQMLNLGASRTGLLLGHIDLIVRHCFYNGLASILPCRP